MRVTFDWTVAGTVGGAVVGSMLWLTDPGNPHFSLARSAIEGAAWGTAVGLGMSFYIMQRTAQRPQGFAGGPGALAPSRRASSDPLGDEMARADLFASAQRQPAAGGFVLPVLNFRF